MNVHVIGQAPRGLAVFKATSVVRVLVAWLGLSLAGIGVAHAGSFNVNPVRVTLSAKQPVAAITVRNTSTEAAVVQLEASSWSQDQGQEVLAATADLLATPPIFTVPPGGTQIVRVGLRGSRNIPAERTYRLVLREVPSENPRKGLQVTLKISMPVFVLPATSVAPQLAWRATRTADGKVRVHATNNGNAHVQLHKLELAAGASVLGSRDIAEYVLPGNSRSWLVNASNAPAVGASLSISTTSDAGPIKSDVALEIDTAASQGAPASSLAAR